MARSNAVKTIPGVKPGGSDNTALQLLLSLADEAVATSNQKEATALIDEIYRLFDGQPYRTDQ